MRNFRILWADDQLVGARAESDQDVFLRAIKSLSDIAVEIKVLASAADVLLAPYDPSLKADLIIFDWFFPNSTIDSEKVIAALNRQVPGVPVIIFSSNPPVGILGVYPNVRAAVDKSNVELLVRTVQAHLQRIMPTIIHFSDLHFGVGHGHGGLQSYESLLESMQAELDGFLAEAQPNTIVVSGDLTSRGSRDEFRCSRDFFAEVTKKLGLGRDSVFVVPGNHDVQLSDPYAFNCYFEHFVERFYCDFPHVIAAHLRKPSDDRIDQEDVAWVRSPAGIRATLIGLNSVTVSDKDEYRVGSFPLGTLGNIRNHQLTEISQKLKTFRKSDDICIAVLHHQMFPIPSRQPGNEPEISASDDNRVVMGQASLLNWFGENGVQIILHGHTHYPAARTVQTHYSGRWQQSGYPIHILAAGTTGAAYVPRAFPEHHYSLLQTCETADGLTLEVHTRVLPPDLSGWRTDPAMSASLRLSPGLLEIA